MTLDVDSSREFNDRAVESVQQDETVCMCRLILLYALRKINAESRTAAQGFRKIIIAL